ncbi:MAG: tripartite tricarboxylate transporter TctB family protein [Deltaproteobacteria bacterium]|jgi:putative tricarboxylic transport membrane protein|nr:tripartite tricarboxylate transporter TctB family protein [Deltaproteobacteria bacterium]
MRKGLIAASILLMGLSLYGIIESSRLERTMQMGVGIAFFPLSMSIGIGILAAVLLVGILKGKVEIKDEPICEKGGAWRVVTVVAILLAYIILIEAIGYVPSTFLFFAATVLFLGKGRILKTLLTSAACTFFLYAIFRVWLKSPLPTGFLGM